MNSSKLSLIICTFMRPKPLLDLLYSVNAQTLYPDEILIIDGSLNDFTEEALTGTYFKNLIYYKVSIEDRGLTKQRNFGIQKVSEDTDIICFLDDDTILDTHYFEEILKTYTIFPEALGVGGYISNEVPWVRVDENYKPTLKDFCYDGWKREDGSRFVFRKRMRLDADQPPGFLPEFSHGRSISFLPPSGAIYKVEQLMGGVSSFRKKIFESIQFSTYFEGYGLYEDADFTLRLSKRGLLYVNTKATLSHFHAISGRPNQFLYGKMVVRNGWYVWRVKYPNPRYPAKLKWHSITLLLSFIRFSNFFTTSRKLGSLTEFLGRLFGWFSLFYDTPQLKE